MKQRKIVKINKSWLGSPLTNSSPAPRSTVHNSSTPPHFSQTSAPGSTQMTPPRSCSPPTRTTALDEETHHTMRAKLFAKVGSQWVNRGYGTLACIGTASHMRVKLVDKDGSILLDVHVKQMLHITKLIKETSKGASAHIRFHLGNEVFLIQVKPVVLDVLFSTLNKAVST